MRRMQAVLLSVLLISFLASSPVNAQQQATGYQPGMSPMIQVAIEVHVSPDGNDANPGTEAEPFATIQRAQQAVRAELTRRKKDPKPGDDPENINLRFNVIIHSGAYRMTEPLRFGPEDGVNIGSVNYTGPVNSDETAFQPGTYGSELPSEQTTISGGRPIIGWTANDDGTWSATIPEVKSGDWTFRQLWAGENRAVRAREPDEGYFRVEKVGEDRLTNFTYNEGDLKPVDDIEGVELVFLLDWSIARVPVKSIDPTERRLTVASPVGTGSGWSYMDWFEKQPRYFVENSREYLDTPGEWYLDETTGVLTYYPLPGEKINETEIIAPVAKQLLVIEGTDSQPVRGLQFSNLTFEHTAWSAPDNVYRGRQAGTYWTDHMPEGMNHCEADPAAIQIDKAEGIGLENVTIRHIGSSGIWAEQQCKKISISESTVTDCGANGIMLGEGQTRTVDGQPWWQSAPEQATSKTVVLMTEVSDCGQELFGAVGIWAGLANNTTVWGNRIHDLPYTGVSMGWMWWNPRDLERPRKTPCHHNMITANEIHHCMQTLSDGGGIYCLGDQPDSEIVLNKIHDIPLNAGRAESNGMFLDQGTGGFYIFANTIYNIDKSPLRFHKGWENLVEYNMLVTKPGVPPIRYNDTVESRIKQKGNIVTQSLDEAMKMFQELQDEIKASKGVNVPL